MDKRNDPDEQKGLDPDIASLLDIEEAEPAPEIADGPDFHTLFTEEKPQAKQAEEVDLTKARFPTIIKIQEDHKPYFQDKDFYRKVLAGEGEEGTRVHDLLGKYMKAEDPEEKSHFRIFDPRRAPSFVYFHFGMPLMPSFL